MSDEIDYLDSDAKAASILTAMVLAAPNYSVIPKPILHWYLERRRIDLAALEAHDGTEAEIASVRNDIATIEVVGTHL